MAILKSGYVMRKHNAKDVLEGITKELEAVRARSDLATNDAAMRYEFLLEAVLALGEAVRDLSLANVVPEEV